MKINNWLHVSAAAVPDRVALVAQNRSASYAELQVWAAAAARHLRRMGITRGDRVALVFESSIESVVLLQALMKVGGVAVPLDPRLPGQELDARLGELAVRLVISEPDEIAEGMEADIVAVAGNPLTDVTEMERVKFVMKGGAVMKNDLASRPAPSTAAR